MLYYKLGLFYLQSRSISSGSAVMWRKKNTFGLQSRLQIRRRPTFFFTYLIFILMVLSSLLQVRMEDYIFYIQNVVITIVDHH